MKRLNEQGVANPWLLAFGFTLILFFAAAGFGIWAYGGMQDYKNNVEPKITAAVEEAQKATEEKKDKEFAEKEKEPLKTYTAPAAYGSVAVSYPKTWSAYVDESGKGSAPVDGSFNPSFVPGLQSGNNVSLRLEVVNQQYSQVVQSFEQPAKTGKITAAAYTLPKVSGTVGLRFDGEIVTKKQGAMVILPLRDKTIKVWTESSQFVPDFNNIILANLSFIP